MTIVVTGAPVCEWETSKIPASVGKIKLKEYITMWIIKGSI